MNKTRPLNELYKIVLVELYDAQKNNQFYYTIGTLIAFLLFSLQISLKEKDILLNHSKTSYTQLNFIQRIRFGLVFKSWSLDKKELKKE